MKNSTICLFFILLFIFQIAKSQDTILKWQSFEEVGEKFNKQQKPIMIFCYDPNDKLSQKMLTETFGNSEIASYLNVLFYNINFDLTDKDSITFFNGQKFGKGAKYHTLSNVLFGSQQIIFPSIVIFDKNAQGRIFEGFKNRDSLFPVLIYYSEEVYTSTEYDSWEKLYFKAYPPGLQTIITRLNLNWLTMSELPNAMASSPKKVLIDIYNNYSVSQTVMRLQIYNDPEIAEYIKKHFYPVLLNYKSDEEFEFRGVKYSNSNPPNGYHQFAIASLEGKMRFPAFLILDEQLNLLDRVQFFTDKEFFMNIAEYFASDIYKNKDFKTFLEEKKNKPK